jgi:hypothetical protein
MDDPVQRYLSAFEAGDIDGIMSALAPDVEVVSPISGRMVFRGQDDVRVLSPPSTGASGTCAGPEPSARATTASPWERPASAQCG